jgi:2-polyprenyl-6-methoxyphenol hydroxylase-like FAD-dependent oxidoreductase
MNVKIDTPVLVVGAGPTGLMMASELRRRGIDCRIIDKLPEPTDKSKALAIHARTLELFEIIGIAEDAVALGIKAHGATSYANGKRIVHVTFDELDSPFPFALLISQVQTEKMLGEHLQNLGGKVERSAELIGFEQNNDCATATIKHGDEREEKITAQYVIGCDGAHSIVRHVLGFSFEGHIYPETFALADVALKWDLPDDEITSFLHEDVNLVFFPMVGGRYRVLAQVPDEQAKGEAPPLENFQKLCDKYCPFKVTLGEPDWLAYFKIHRRSVQQYRQGRAFLAGDAGHIHSPVGGQGMNTGMQDAFNLAWKLALVLKGQAPESLLDTYQEERHPIAKALLMGTDMATKVLTIRNPVAQTVRNSLGAWLVSLDVVQQRIIKTGSMLALNYRRSPLVGESRGTAGGGIKNLEGHIASFLEFGHGPAPGDRAPDADITLAAGNKTATLFNIFAGTEHRLLLFAGLKSSNDSYKRLQDIANQVKSKYGELVKTTIISGANGSGGGSSTEPSASNAAGNGGAKMDTSLVLDPEGIAHHKYGAQHECLYLIRPDGYVGFRSQPAEFEPLVKHLSKILLPERVRTV